MARILVVDDEKLARLTVRKILEQAGHAVSEASNGADGIRLFRENPYELVITDIIMPEKDGIQTIAELRHEFPALQMIAISGGGRTRNLDFLKLAQQYGAAKVLAKPFSPDDLLTAVSAVLQNKATDRTPGA